MRIFWPVDGRQRLVELQFNSSGRADGANPRVGLGFALKEAEAGRSRRTHCQDDACSTRRRRLAMQPSTFAEGGKIDARGGIPPASSIAGAKPQGGLLVAVGNPQWRYQFPNSPEPALMG
jgi:hypothetical protein